ncbi:GvpL/GvpF family gas vesicle protein [Patescibacteria group bacterium]|nr:GvpL/GvpF family gas vesicle protein [Patescibacteria group bacterium]MBU4057255.1 GvpL/GvpF family gas vesicle protein [Patescibacteria group bacterium]
MTQEGKFIYGFISTKEQKNLGSIGIEQGDVYFFPYKDVAAVVSDLPLIQFDSLPRETLLRNLAVYQAVIEMVMKSHHIIPMKFGTVVQGEEDLKKMLEKGYGRINTNLKEMENKIELDVAALWSNFDSILKEIGEEEEIKRLKEEALTKPPEQVFEIKVQLGKLVKDTLDKKREQCASQLSDVLKKDAANYRSHAVMDDSMIMNTAFLIDKDRQETFETKVDQLDKQYNGGINFRIVGPLPPYSFTTLEMKTVEFGEVNEAKEVLGLGEEATILEIKSAYREMSKRFHPDKYPGDPEAQKRFEKMTKAYQMLNDYCNEDRCSFKEVDVRGWIDVRRSVVSG